MNFKKISILLVLLLPLTSCKPRPSKGNACDLQPGDIVFNELMLEDLQQNDWLELANTTEQSLSLNRAQIEIIDEKQITLVYEIKGIPDIAARAFSVISQQPFTELSSSIAIDSFKLPNYGGSIRLTCRGIIIDEVHYGNELGESVPMKGVSFGFDSTMIQSPATQNDVPAYWCAQHPSHTLAAKNISCGINQCLLNEQWVEHLATPQNSLYLAAIQPQTESEPYAWLEIYNTGESAIDLNGVLLSNHRNPIFGHKEDSMWRIAAPHCLRIEPSRSRKIYFLSPNIPEVPSKLIDEAFIRGDLLQGESHLSVTTLEKFLLTARYNTSNGNQTIELESDSPMCRDAHGGFRASSTPSSGHILITEVMNDPEGADGNQEWIELYNNSAITIDLNGLSVIQSIATEEEKNRERTWALKHRHCMSVAPHQYITIGIIDKAEASWLGSHTPHFFSIGENLYNQASLLSLRTPQNTISTLALSESTSGVSTQIETLQSADHATCQARFATPGNSNVPCGELCLEASHYRTPHFAKQGDLRIKTVMPNPVGKDNFRDWLEILVTSEKAIDLYGLELVNVDPVKGSTRKWSLETEQCMPLSHTNTLRVAGKNTVLPTDNGILVILLDKGTDSLFLNKSSELHIMRGEQVIDSVTYPDLDDDEVWSRP